MRQNPVRITVSIALQDKRAAKTGQDVYPAKPGPGDRRIYQDTCQPCPDNMYSFAGTDCLTCSSGHRVNADKDGCEPCPKGFRVSASGGCERCASGTVSLTERSTWCVECESGMTASDDGTACITTEVDCGDAPFLDNGSGEKKGNTVKFSCVTR